MVFSIVILKDFILAEMLECDILKDFILAEMLECNMLGGNGPSKSSIDYTLNNDGTGTGTARNTRTYTAVGSAEYVPVIIPDAPVHVGDGFRFFEVYTINDGPASQVSPRELGYNTADKSGISHQPYANNLQKALQHCSNTNHYFEIKKYFSEKDLRYIRQLNESINPGEPSQHLFNSVELRRALYHLR